MADHLIKITSQQHSHLLAAMRLLQATPVSCGSKHDQMIDDIATNGGEIEPMTKDEIDTFCEELNTGGLDATFSDCVEHHAYGGGDARIDAIIENARDNTSEGEIEIDDSVVISDGGDGGAYVMAWIWGGE